MGKFNDKNYSRVSLNGEVLIDLTEDTVKPEDVLEGETFHDSNGVLRTGTSTVAQDLATLTGRVENISLTEGEGDDSGKLILNIPGKEPQKVQGGFLPDEETTDLENNKMVAIALKDKTTGNVLTPADINNEVENINREIDALEGVGGYLIPHNFETATPNLVNGEEDDIANNILSPLTQYAVAQIRSIENPQDIWNGTRVTNLYDKHTWILNNNYPGDFSWTDLGVETVAIANTSTAGVVKSSTDHLKISVNSSTGEMSVNNLETTLDTLKTDILNEVNNEESQRTVMTIHRIS